jgi:hypothetical protein
LSTRLREYLPVVLLALLGSILIVRSVSQPTYTDAFYHYNAAVRFASGDGLTDTTLWTYIGQPADQPTSILIVPSHLYWMPFSSLAAGTSMRLLNAAGHYPTAQLPNILWLTGAILIAFHLGNLLGKSSRHAWTAALLTLFSGFFTRFWGEIDTFAPYAFFGALSLLAITHGLISPHEGRRALWFGLGGLAAGVGHLTRSDGLLLLIVGVMCALTPTVASGRRFQARTTLLSLTVLVIGYLVVMSGWFERMISVTGAPLPLGGLQGAWLTEYNDLFRYPPDASAAEFFTNGLGLFIETRWTAFLQNLQTLFFVEGWIVLMPLILIGLWQLWRSNWRMVLPVILFVLGLHAAMTFVFPLPGWRGGLFHGASALIPWWSAMVVVGLDAVIDWIAHRRRSWRPQQAKIIFTGGIVLLAAILSFANVSGRSSTSGGISDRTQILLNALPADARVLINDPSRWYYETGQGGAVLPNESPEVIPQIAAQYGITHVILEQVETRDGRLVSLASPAPLQTILTDPPEFLRPVEVDMPDVRVYEIVTP